MKLYVFIVYVVLKIRIKTMDFFKDWTSYHEISNSSDWTQHINSHDNYFSNFHREPQRLHLFNREQHFSYDPNRITVTKSDYTMYEHVQEFMPKFYKNIGKEYRHFYKNKYDVTTYDDALFSQYKMIPSDISTILDKKFLSICENLFHKVNNVFKFLENEKFIEMCNKYHIYTPKKIADMIAENNIEDAKKILDEEYLETKKILREYRQKLFDCEEKYKDNVVDVEYHLSDSNSDYDNYYSILNQIVCETATYADILLDKGIYPAKKILSDLIERNCEISLPNNEKFTYII